MSEYTVICAQCFEGEIHPVTDEWLGGKPVRGHYECASCGAASGLWMDGGMLDISDLPEPTLDFEIFP